jgi:hypothetical protein
MSMYVFLLYGPATRISNAAGAYISAESSCGGAPYNKYYYRNSPKTSIFYDVKIFR